MCVINYLLMSIYIESYLSGPDNSLIAVLVFIVICYM